MDEVFRRLNLWPLGADQSEDHHLVVWNVPERCKRARPIVVVFQEKPRCTDALKNRPGNWLIVSLDEPTAFLVATTEVDGEGHIGKSRHDGVVELDRVQYRLSRTGELVAADQRILTAHGRTSRVLALDPVRR